MGFPKDAFKENGHTWIWRTVGGRKLKICLDCKKSPKQQIKEHFRPSELLHKYKRRYKDLKNKLGEKTAEKNLKQLKRLSKFKDELKTRDLQPKEKKSKPITATTKANNVRPKTIKEAKEMYENYIRQFIDHPTSVKSTETLKYIRRKFPAFDKSDYEKEIEKRIEESIPRIQKMHEHAKPWFESQKKYNKAKEQRKAEKEAREQEELEEDKPQICPLCGKRFKDLSRHKCKMKIKPVLTKQEKKKFKAYANRIKKPFKY